MITMNINDVPPQMQSFLAQILAGESVTLCAGNKPVIEMKPLVVPVVQQAKGERMLGNPPFTMEIPDSFFDPLPDDMLDAFEGKGSDKL